MQQGSEQIVILCTCPDSGVADNMAGVLVGERLAACVNILPGVVSWFRWQGKMERADECLLLIKTTRTRYPALEAKIRALHPYEVPEIIAVPITLGQGDYLAWIDRETG